MKNKWWIFLLLLLFAGCQIPNGSEDKQEEKGIHYSAMDGPEYRRYYPTACYACSVLRYAGQVYTSTEIYQSENKWDLPWHMKKEELSDVYGNGIIYWSVEKEKLFSTTNEGVLYKVAGYEENVKIGLYCEKETELAESGKLYYFILFEHLNDIWLDEGKDLYQTKLHFDEAASVSGLSPEDETVKEFMDALFEAKFIDPKSKELPKWINRQYQNIFVYDSFGVSTNLKLYEVGYVVRHAVGKGGEPYFILQLDEELCKELLEKIE